MAFGVIGSIIDAIKYGPEGSDFAAMSIMGINPIDQSTMLPERTFQFWPETISDTVDIGWSFKDVPGASHALAQWSSNGGRTITFEVPFHRFMKPVDSRSTLEKALDPFNLNTPSSEYLKDNRPYNVDITAEIRYLRAFYYPSYKDIDNYTTAFPPPIAMLNVPGLRLEDGSSSDIIYVIMTGYDLTYNLLFPDGTPRRANLALTFRQIIQDPLNKKISQRGFYQDKPFKYAGSIWDTVEDPAPYPGGNRAKNGLDGWGNIG